MSTFPQNKKNIVSLAKQSATRALVSLKPRPPRLNVKSLVGAAVAAVVATLCFSLFPRFPSPTHVPQRSSSTPSQSYSVSSQSRVPRDDDVSIVSNTNASPYPLVVVPESFKKKNDTPPEQVVRNLLNALKNENLSEHRVSIIYFLGDAVRKYSSALPPSLINAVRQELETLKKNTSDREVAQATDQVLPDIERAQTNSIQFGIVE